MNQEEINKVNEKELERAKLENVEFKENFSKGMCYICNLKLSDFTETRPCLHWLLMPDGFKKEHFTLITQNFEYTQIDSYLRWVANHEILFQNINDLPEERKGSMMFEHIIKYKNLEWSFSCSKNDFYGHKDSTQGKNPHYHFQMRVNDRPFIDFGNFHIPLSDHDKFIIKVKLGEIKGLAHFDGFGSGMKSLVHDSNPDELLKHAKTTEDPHKETIHTSYIIQAESGKLISGNEIADLMEESKRTGTPLWNLLHRLSNAKATALVGPGDAVPEIFHRKGRGRKNEK